MSKHLKVLELFAGTRSVGCAFQERGHEVLSVDWDERFDVDIHKDVLELFADEILEKLGKPDVIWASPDCTTYSIAAISHHRERDDHGNLAAKSDYAKLCDRVNMHVHNLVMMLTPPHCGSLRTLAAECARWTSCTGLQGTRSRIANMETIV